MKTSKLSKFAYLKKPIFSGAAFFATFALLSLAYAGWATPVPNNVITGQTLTKDMWNNMANELADHDSKISTLTANSGKVLQVGYVAKADTWSATTSGNNFYTVPGLSVTITPSSTTNKILLTPSLYAGTSNYQIKFRFLRNGTPVILGAGEGGRPVTTGVINPYDPTALTQGYQVAFLGGTYMDSPATTSPVTYDVQMAAYDANTVYLNRSVNWQANAAAGYDATPVSTLTVMEIKN